MLQGGENVANLALFAPIPYQQAMRYRAKPQDTFMKSGNLLIVKRKTASTIGNGLNKTVQNTRNVNTLE